MYASEYPLLTPALLRHGAKVYLAARRKAQAEEVIENLKDATGKEAIFLHLDLTSLAAARAAAIEFLSRESELHILSYNAQVHTLSHVFERNRGVMNPPIKALTADGFDMRFSTNVVGTSLTHRSLFSSHPALRELALRPTAPPCSGCRSAVLSGRARSRRRGIKQRREHVR